MTPIFEILASLCLGAICTEHVLPVPTPMSRVQCEQGADATVERWLAAHPGYSASGRSCQPLEALADRAATMTEYAPGGYVHFGKVQELGPGSDGDLANTGFIIGRDAVAVIDAGTTRRLGEALYLAIRSRTDLPIRWMIVTHMHPDHVLGAEALREAGARIVGHEKLAEALSIRAGPYLANMRRLLGDEVMQATAVAMPDRVIGQAEEIDLGGRILRLTSHPTAHTNNDLTVLDVAADTLWTGDLVFLEHVPALDGSINGWISVLEEMSQQDVGFIVPGHGRLVAPHPDGLGPILAYLTALRREVREALVSGESLQTAIRHVGADLQGDWQVFDAFNARNATNAYVELEWE